MKRSKYIDHTLLKADAQEGEIIRLCDEAKQHDFASVCVYSYWAKTCAEQLKGTGIKVCCVAGFPSGAMSTAAKAFEAAEAIRSGADEIDMVMNIGELKAGHADAVRRDIEAVVQACAGHPVKVILETCLLSREEIARACMICADAGASFVKTSTGFSTGGASVEAVRLMKETLDGRCQVKASGGIRTAKDMDRMIEAGADRIGASAGAALLDE